MIAASLFLEKFLQNYRFKMVKPYLIGDVMDFGGNKGELKKYVSGTYLLVNYDHSIMDGISCDSIIVLAVIEHIEMDEVFKIFNTFKTILRPGGRIFLTTPTPLAKPILELLARVGFLEKDNIAEHKHYWTKAEITKLAVLNKFSVKRYSKFQLGCNQLAVFEHSKDPVTNYI